MKLLLENWRKYEEEVLEEGMLGDIAASIKAGFKKIMDVPGWFDSKVEETQVSFEEILIERLKALSETPEMQNAGQEVAGAINANFSEEDVTRRLKALTEKMAAEKKFSISELREMGVGPETIELIGHSVSGAAAESVIGAAEKVVGKVMPPKLKNVLIRVFSNFIGSFIFGFIDNFIMVIAGNYIDASIGAALGGFGGAMLAAGFGNTVSDIAGKLAEKKIESSLKSIGIDVDSVSDEEMKQTSKFWQFLDSSGAVFGIALGCLVGMFPLLLEEQEKDETPT
jgi:tRNA-specific adenosine deaminase 1